MNLLLIDLRLAVPVPPSPAAPPAPELAGWSLQLQRARAAVGAPELAARESARTELESCGFPLAPGAAPALCVVPQLPSHAASEEPLPPAPGREREGERAPLRVHVQAEPADVLKVWLGIDGDATRVAQRAGAAVAGLLRSVQPTGGRIAAIVCNGMPVYPCASLESSVVKEAPWPSVR